MVQLQETRDAIQMKPLQEQRLTRFGQRINNLDADFYVFNMQGDSLLCIQRRGRGDLALQQIAKECIALSQQPCNLDQHESQSQDDVHYLETLGSVLVTKLHLSDPAQGIPERSSQVDLQYDSARVVDEKMLSAKDTPRGNPRLPWSKPSGDSSVHNSGQEDTRRALEQPPSRERHRDLFRKPICDGYNQASCCMIAVDWRNQTTSTQQTMDAQKVIFSEMIACLVDSFQTANQTDRQMEMVGSELSHVYEELVLLHKLSTNMKVTESDANFLQLACDSLTEVVSVEGIAIVLERWQEYDRSWSVVAGSGLIDLDTSMATTVYGRLLEEIENGREALLDSDVFSVFKYQWPDSVRNLIAVPLHGKDIHESHLVQSCKGKEAMIGYMVAINALHKKDFDSTDIKLFNTVANRCAVFIENGRLFGDLQELFMGSLRALTSSIDAKDGYTHGHSERVALISRWIADHAVEAKLLTPEQAQESYFSGLLHDIGKIGIEDWVLRKEGPLTDEELERIHNHPLIGAGILRGIKQMKHIVPGVLHHHERFDGKGYPNGLVGEEIPILARIVCLADSFDAMTSRRSYRKAMSVEEATGEIEKNLGKQFDPELGKVFIETKMDRLWQLMQGGSETDFGRDIHEYGANAVGTLVR